MVPLALQPPSCTLTVVELHSFVKVHSPLFASRSRAIADTAIIARHVMIIADTTVFVDRVPKPLSSDDRFIIYILESKSYISNQIPCPSQGRRHIDAFPEMPTSTTNIRRSKLRLLTNDCLLPNVYLPTNCAAKPSRGKNTVPVGLQGRIG